MKSVLVTGASTGIGRACALLLVEHGNRVFAGVRKESDADGLMQQAGERLIPVMLDVTDSSSIDATAKTIASQVGEEGLHGLVNNAGVAFGGPLEFLPIDVFRTQLEVNVIGQIAVIFSSRPKRRYLVGIDAKVGGHVTRVMPDRVKDSTFGRLTGFRVPKSSS